MNAHIPDQLDQLSKKELVEVSKIMHETNVDLNAQLAKANERVSILEKERDHSQRMYNSLLGDLSAGYGALSIPECESQLNKFAIEQQIKGLKDYQALCGFADCRKSIDARIAQLEEQLRKEQK